MIFLAYYFTGNMKATVPETSEKCGYLFPLLLYRSTSGSGVVGGSRRQAVFCVHWPPTAPRDQTFPLCACINIYLSSSAYQYWHLSFSIFHLFWFCLLKIWTLFEACSERGRCNNISGGVKYFPYYLKFYFSFQHDFYCKRFLNEWNIFRLCKYFQNHKDIFLFTIFTKQYLKASWWNTSSPIINLNNL